MFETRRDLKSGIEIANVKCNTQISYNFLFHAFCFRGACLYISELSNYLIVTEVPISTLLAYFKTVFTSVVFASSTFASALKVEPRQLGPLNAIVIDHVKDAPYVVYLHGFGGLGDSAYQELAPEIEKNRIFKSVNWIFPDAPRGGWFNIEAIDPHTTEPLYDVWQSSLKPTRQALTQMLKSAKIDPRNVIWAGFSQGGITAIDYVLHSNVSPKGLIVNSGIYFDSTDWKKGSPHLKGVRFFMNHDRNDQSLPYALAKKAEALLLENGMIGKLTATKDDHTMWPNTIKKAIGELQKTPSHSCAKFF